MTASAGGVAERVRVEVAQPYDVEVGAGILDRIGDLVGTLAEPPTGAVVLADEAVAADAGERVRARLEAAGFRCRVHPIRSGEASKTLEGYGAALAAIADAGLDRAGLVLAVGGGVVGDLAGFAAATYHRGVRTLQVPTTLLAMVDSSVGGKTGINLPHGKNLVGAFWHPVAVVADVDTLATLPRNVLRHGGVELYKAGLLGDAAIVEAFEETGAFGSVVERGGAGLVELVARGVAVKARVVEADPREAGVRATLNLGHTIGHALEAASRGSLPHGAAVAYGLVAAAEIGAARGLVDWRERARAVCRWAADAPLPEVPFDELLERLGRDKKAVGGRRRFVLLEDLGRAVVVDDVRDDEIRRAIDALREVLG